MRSISSPHCLTDLVKGRLRACISGMVQVMYHAEWAHGMGWKGELRPYEPLRLLPSAQCLNYGQAVFEGLKAQRTAKGRIALFRPDQNAARMAAGD